MLTEFYVCFTLGILQHSYSDTIYKFVVLSL